MKKALSHSLPAKPTNHEIAHALAEVAALLEARSANPFRIHAYRGAAQVVQSLPDVARYLKMREM